MTKQLSKNLIARIRKYLRLWFRYWRGKSVTEIKNLQPVPKRDRDDDSHLSVESADWDHNWTLDALLFDLNDTFKWLEKRISYCSNYRVIHAARHFGPFIAHHATSEAGRYDYCYMGFPAMFFLATNFGRFRIKRKGWVFPCAILAVRGARQPWYAEKIGGVPYCYSLCFDVDGKISWHDIDAVINAKTGAIKIPRTYWRQDVRIEQTNGRRGHEGIHYSRPVYGEQEVIKMHADDVYHGDTKKAKKQMREGMAWCLNTYWTSETACQIFVKKNKTRAVFCIPQERVVSFFRYRDKAELTLTGKRRSIFHLVRAHYRRTQRKVATVVMHKRGRRHFAWHGYDCTIFAHGWHGQSTAQFQAGGHDTEKGKQRPDGLIDINITAARIAAHTEGRRLDHG